MFGFSVMSYFNRTIMSIAGPVIMKEFSLTETEMGSVYSAFLWSYALLMIPGGALADRFGPRVVLTAMAMGSAAFTALTAWGGVPGLGVYVGVIPSFILMRLGLGLFTAPLYPACGRMNANWMEADYRGRTQGWVNSGAGLGGAVSPILFSSMIAVYGWRVAFTLAGIATAILGRGLVPLRTGSSRGASGIPLEPTKLSYVVASATDGPQSDLAHHRHGRPRIFRIHLLLLDLLLPRRGSRAGSRRKRNLYQFLVSYLAGDDAGWRMGM